MRSGTKKTISEERYLTVRDYAGDLMSLNSDNSLLDIVKLPAEINIKGMGKCIIPFSPPDISEKEIGEVTEALRSDWITTGLGPSCSSEGLPRTLKQGDTTIDCNTDVDGRDAGKEWKNVSREVRKGRGEEAGMKKTLAFLVFIVTKILTSKTDKTEPLLAA